MVERCFVAWTFSKFPISAYWQRKFFPGRLIRLHYFFAYNIR
jgi:hypothetical protein